MCKIKRIFFRYNKKAVELCIKEMTEKNENIIFKLEKERDNLKLKSETMETKVNKLKEERDNYINIKNKINNYLSDKYLESSDSKKKIIDEIVKSEIELNNKADLFNLNKDNIINYANSFINKLIKVLK